MIAAGRKHIELWDLNELNLLRLATTRPHTIHKNLLKDRKIESSTVDWYSRLVLTKTVHGLLELQKLGLKTAIH